MRRRAGDGESRLRAASRPVASVTARTRGGARSPTATCAVRLLEQEPVSLFHVRLAVTLVRTNGARPRRGAAERAGVAGRGHAFKLVEDGVLVSEEIAHEAVGVLLLQRQRCLGLGAEDAGRKGGG